MIHLFHTWKAVAARHRNQPVYRDPAYPLFGVEDAVTTPKTDVLFKCSCGKLKSVAIPGKWELKDLQA